MAEHLPALGSGEPEINLTENEWVAALEMDEIKLLSPLPGSVHSFIFVRDADIITA